MDNAFQIQRIYISQAFQGMGLGKQLFEFALQEARDLGCDWAWLGVWERNFKAQIFYDKNTIFQLVMVKLTATGCLN